MVILYTAHFSNCSCLQTVTPAGLWPTGFVIAVDFFIFYNCSFTRLPIVSLQSNPNCASLLWQKISTLLWCPAERDAILAGRIFYHKNLGLLRETIGSMRFPKKKNGGVAVEFLILKLLAMLMKPFSELTIEDKAMLLHILFPGQIRSFILFSELHINKLLDDPQAFFESWDTEAASITSDKWIEVLKEMNVCIHKKVDSLSKDPSRFIELFTKGYMLTVFFECLKEYMSICIDNRLVSAIEFLFDF